MGGNIIHITLSILLFFSTSGIQLNSHFCSGKYKYSSLFVQPKNCCKKVKVHLPSKDSCQDEANQIPCCQNKANFFKSSHPQNYTSDTSQEVTFPSFKVIVSAFLFIGHDNFQRLDIDYLNYKPPLIKEDIPSLFQIFRC